MKAITVSELGRIIELQRRDNAVAIIDSPYNLADQNFQNINLKHSEFAGCDFSGALFLLGHDFSNSRFEKCVFLGSKKTNALMRLERANMKNAKFTNSNLNNAVLFGANLVNSDFSGADLSNCDLRETNCADGNLLGTNLHLANLYGAKFERTRMSLNKIPIIHSSEELWINWHKLHKEDTPHFSNAARISEGILIYLELKKNFKSIGAYSEASWAYKQERWLRRDQHSPFMLKENWASEFPQPNLLKTLQFYLVHTLFWILDSLVGITTGFGESLLRTTLTLFLFTLVVFPTLFLVAGGIELSATTQANNSEFTSNYYYYLLWFSIGNIIQGYPDLKASSEIGNQIQVIQQFFSIMMIGLIGYVLGNKINQN